MSKLVMFENATIRTRILGLIGFGVAMIILLAGTSIYTLTIVENDINVVLKSYIIKRISYGEIRKYIGYGGLIHNFKNYVIRRDNNYKKAYQSNLEDLRNAMDRYRSAGNLIDLEQEALRKVEDFAAAYSGKTERISELIRIGASMDEIDAEVKIDDTPFLTSLDELEQYLVSQWQLKTREIADKTELINILQIFIAPLTIVLLIIFGLLIVRSITQPLENLTKVAGRLGQGNLKERISISGENEISQLAEAFNQMTDSLTLMVKETQDAANSVASMVQELQSAVGSQSASATQQASSINETTSSLEEIKVTSSQNLEKASAVGEANERIREEGEVGKAMVEQIIDGMREIRGKVATIAENIMALSEQTQQIGDITTTVNSLSQQLKMLGLNASIEAAKAGEAGQGFAVVAGEVKDLAEQSQQATIQVHKILEAIQLATDKAVMVTEEGSKGVDEGVFLVEKTGEAINNLSKVIGETSVASKQIVAAVRQEVSGIDQVTQAMSEINQATTQMVTATEQTKGVAMELGNIADNLQSNITAYKV